MSRIFIVEDDATHRNELVKLLSRYGYTGIVSDDFENIVLEVLSTAPAFIFVERFVNNLLFQLLFLQAAVEKWTRSWDWKSVRMISLPNRLILVF